MRYILLAGLIVINLAASLACCCSTPGGSKAAAGKPQKVESGERNGATYFVEVAPSDGITICQLVFSKDPRDPKFVDRALYSAVETAAAKDDSLDILGMAFVNDDLMGAGQCSGTIIFRAGEKKIFRDGEKGGVSSLPDDPARAERKAKRRADFKAAIDAKDKATIAAHEAKVMRLTDDHQAAVEKYEVAKAAYLKAAPLYEKAQAEYDAAKKLAAARPPAGATPNLLDVYRRKQQAIIDAYPDTAAADDAKFLMKHGYLGARKLPAEPAAPVQPTAPPALKLPPAPEPTPIVYPDDPEDVAAAAAQEARAAASTSGGAGGASSGGKSVHVSGYTTKNGTYVAPHSRGAPGTGKHK